MLNSFPQGDQTAIHDYPIVPLGTCIVDDQDDREWVYLKARNLLAKGDALASSTGFITVANLANAAAAGSREITFDAGDIDATALALIDRIPKYSNNGEYPELYVNGGAGIGQSAIIIERDGRTFTLYWDSSDGRLATALTTTSDVEIFATWWALQASNTIGTIAFAQAVIAQDKYFWGLRKGRGVAVAHDTITRSVALAPTELAADFGELEPYDATDIQNAVAIALTAAANGSEFPIIANINTPISQVLYSKAPYIPGYNRPD